VNPNAFLKDVQYDNPGAEFQRVRAFDRYSFDINRCDPATTDAYVLAKHEVQKFAGEPTYLVKEFDYYAVALKKNEVAQMEIAQADSL
jgi:hypothetical protein